ncbi:cytochrome P450 [Arthrobacter sp. ATA002]|uniref:cytochrome P450 n=1 Tax=Arthrobacter sp. ATA002 TaxID=2991715 RepID=UPI0022A68646|nr:cytochrome P450 [Arthrobacter sp. ATA002]WAP50688.1 cytochrome P450 [Arthrobacter sp. ATA002]
MRRQAVILQPDQLHYVLENSPDPFSPASSEKKAALNHFEPRNVLISQGRERTVRRALQEQVLDTHSPVHRLASSFLPVIDQETAQLLEDIERTGRAVGNTLAWEDFISAWYRIVRRTVFGDHARDDEELTHMITELRRDGNWSFLKPPHRRLRARFLQRVRDSMDTAGPGSLAHTLRNLPEHKDAAPVEQIPQWLFAFDPAGMAAFRTLALLSTHPEQQARAVAEIREDTTGGQQLPYLRACVLESLRLWSTTPMILRQSTREVHWPDGTMPGNCGVLIYTPYFHRDEDNLPHAHAFRPERWLADAEDTDWPMVPFSEGPVICPGRQLVLMMTSAMLASLLENRTFTLASSQHLSPKALLPGTLDHFSLRFTIHDQDQGAPHT